MISASNLPYEADGNSNRFTFLITLLSWIQRDDSIYSPYSSSSAMSFSTSRAAIQPLPALVIA